MVGGEIKDMVLMGDCGGMCRVDLNLDHLKSDLKGQIDDPEYK